MMLATNRHTYPLNPRADKLRKDGSEGCKERGRDCSCATVLLAWKIPQDQSNALSQVFGGETV